MHYIRLLRAPKLTFQEGKKNPWSLNLVLTVTTDLGDSFLAHDEPVKIKVALGWENPRSAKQKPAPMTLAGEKTLQWTSGMRVLKADFPAQHLKPERNLPSGETPLRVYIAAGSGLSAETAADVAMAGFNGEDGKIVPLWANVDVPIQGYKAYGDSPGAPTTCFRRLRLGSEHHPYIEVEEDIGESIARHVWDAGMMVVSRLWLLCNGDSGTAAGHPLGMRTLKSLLFGNKPVNILELGCGVGIFGLGLAHMLGRETMSRKGRLVITDLSEAEERVLSNIELSRSNHAEPQFEELDWDEGRDGSFGPLVEDTHWDLIVLSDCTYNADALPSLIDTWSAIHKQNNAMAEDKPVVTRVLVAMKVRHADEDRLWELVKKDGWAVTEKAAMPLPMLGGEPQEIFLYLFENRRRMLPDGYA
ncbi:Protein-lysine N-methyltransferase EFM6 [Colletotrichum sp. SAR 10_65]|nr:Protein-lysine N-methyltransferase EFM6 [Colletotrichum sp. SAR 10_65]KAI8214098.1 Protein-lysine N-methyltransferase EFM6 [Colletotrichum sp. SAR 10_76]